MIDYNNKVVILKDSMKMNFLKKIDSLCNVKIITLSELKKKYYFDFDKEAILYVSKKYNVLYSIAKKYIDNLYFINDEISTKKIDFLKKIKIDLDENKLLKYDEYFKEYLNNKDIIIYNYEHISKFNRKIFKELSLTNKVMMTDESRTGLSKDLYAFKNINDEISFVANKICNLIKDGIDKNKIKLINVNSNYKYNLKRIFDMFNIPVELENEESICGTYLAKKFEELFSSDIEKTIDELRKFVNCNDDLYVFKQIVNIINSYNFVKDYNDVYDLILDDIKNTKKRNAIYKNSVKVINIDELNDDEYGFLINFNEGVYPANSKDEDYLSDIEYELLGLDTSSDRNKLNYDFVRYYIGHVNNLIVSYTNRNSKGEIFKSGAYQENLFTIRTYEKEYTNSNKYNLIRLLQLQDENRIFGSVNDELCLLSKHYDFDYLTYDNKFNGIDKNILYEYMKKHLSLSFTTMNSFYQCKFKYYLNYILRINKDDKKFNMNVGNVIHKVLSESVNSDFDFESSWSISESEFITYDENDKSSKYFINILKNDTRNIIDIIKKQFNYTQLKKILCEQTFSVIVDDKLNIFFKGTIDKIMFDEFDGETVCSVVDYKTGKLPSIQKKNFAYGLDLQLPCYVYLLKRNKVFSNLRIGGFYLQGIGTKCNTLEEKEESMKLVGFSNEDKSILKYVDSSFVDSQIIKGMKVTNDGSFYSYTKTINDEQIDKLADLVEKKIGNASTDILNANFEIDPKQIKNDNVSCKYCVYRDVCYRSNDDIVVLEEPDETGGDEDVMDD